MNYRNNIFRENEIESNKFAKKITIVCFCTFTVCWFMNFIGVFLFNDFHMNLAFVLGSISLIIPLIANKVLKEDDKRKKYFFIIGAECFLVVINTLLAHHTLVMFLFPMLMAGLYFDKKLTIKTVIINSVMLFITQTASYYVAAVPEKNFSSFKNFMMLGVIPRIAVTVAMTTVIMMMGERVVCLLGNLMGAEEQRILLEKNEKIKQESLEVSNEMLISVDELKETSKVVSETNTQVAEKIAEFVENTVTNVDSINNVNEKIENIVSVISNLNEKSKHINSLSESVKENTLESNKKISSATDSMNSISISTDNCKNTIQLLEEQSNEIVNIVNLITEISSQTKILSLNASIEAARAGEYGKGFVVVADEIHNLSNQTREAVDNIAQIIEEVVSNTNKAVVAMDENVRLTKQGLENIKDAKNASDIINDSNSQMTDEIQGIYEIAKNVNSDSRDIENYVSGMKKSMNESLGGIEYVSAITQESSASAEILVGMVDRIRNMSDKLNVVVNE